MLICQVIEKIEGGGAQAYSAPWDEKLGEEIDRILHSSVVAPLGWSASVAPHISVCPVELEATARVQLFMDNHDFPLNSRFNLRLTSMS